MNSTIDNEFTAATFIAGHYWATDGDASIDLGECDTFDELLEAVAQVEAQGDADWTAWFVSRG